MMTSRCFLLVLALMWCSLLLGQWSLDGVVTNSDGDPLPDIQIVISDKRDVVLTAGDGSFHIERVNGLVKLSLISLNTVEFDTVVSVSSNTFLHIFLKEKNHVLNEIHVNSGEDVFGIRQLRSLENGGLFEGKKTEVINIDNLVANKAANNSRQAFAKIPGLNIWESDQAGLQLDIGGRGLSPKRTSNFNTRQNGYDMSADALGYPESYYTPPLQAVEQIEIVRGAGALQYGSQFGGLVNYRLKTGKEDSTWTIVSENTYGAFNFKNTFNSISNSTDRYDVYAYGYYKGGGGWRENTSFDQWGAYIDLNYALSPSFKLGVQYTHMSYLSQQPGGLTDEDFYADPRQSNRDRNWFNVDWNLMAINTEWRITNDIEVLSKTFGLKAGRMSLGLLETPDLEDPMSNRDLIDGRFLNVGHESRIVYKHSGRSKLDNVLLLGLRIYRGQTNFSQSFGTEGGDADFTEVDTAFLERQKSDFDFPNMNTGLFGEYIWRANDQLSLIPGFRYEYISTEADGHYTNNLRINSFGDFIEERVDSYSQNRRGVMLYGLGLSFKPTSMYEVYANATANYRAINFSDVQIQTNTQMVDPDMEDERGFSFDIGIRRRSFSPFFVDFGVFHIAYNNRIGELIDDGLRLRTNIGAARIFGFEFFGEWDVLQSITTNRADRLSLFLNGSYTYGVYTEISERALVGVRSGNRLEDIPQYNLRFGLTYGFRGAVLSVVHSAVGRQYSDAANTKDSFKGVFGEIPSYHVTDLSLGFGINRWLHFTGSINNLFDRSFFTRRATAYPGPGIIPANGRTWNLTFRVKI